MRIFPKKRLFGLSVLVVALLALGWAQRTGRQASQPSSAASGAGGAGEQGGGRAEVVVSRGEGRRWAIAIHGGAGTIPKSLPEERKQAYLRSMRAALEAGRGVLMRGGKSLDAVERVVRFLEDDSLFNAGKGAVFDHEGGHELDAAIMDGSDLSCGAVAGVRTVKNPISLARLVKERTKHVLLAGEGADRFAAEMGVERVGQDYFFTQYRYDQWQEELKKEKQGQPAPSPRRQHGTVGAVALDSRGNLAAATSTGGTTNKRFGRVGDSPIVGAGTYANDRTCAVSGTGAGEEFIRHAVAHDVSALIEYAGLSLLQAAERVVNGKLHKGDGGVIAVGRDGAIAMVFNSEGMYRGAADSSGRFEVKIWE